MPAHTKRWTVAKIESASVAEYGSVHMLVAPGCCPVAHPRTECGCDVFQSRFMAENLALARNAELDDHTSRAMRAEMMER